MDKKSMVVGIGQLALIVLVWMLNPSAMVEYIDRLALLFGIGCVAGLLAPNMQAFTEDIHIPILGITLEIIYIAALGILWGVVQYNIVIL